MPHQSYRQRSREDWGTTAPDGYGLTSEQIRTGCLLRIADAVEVMAENHAALIAERDQFKRWYDEEREKRASRNRKISALRGVITKLKRKSNG